MDKVEARYKFVTEFHFDPIMSPTDRAYLMQIDEDVVGINPDKAVWIYKGFNKTFEADIYMLWERM